MEVVGVIASSITLLEASLKAIDFFQDLAAVQDDFRSLREEVLDITTIVQDFRSIPRLFPEDSGLPQVAEPRSIARAIAKLEQIKIEIDEITKYCARTPDTNSVSNAKKRKWILKRNQIPRLLTRARDAHACLQTGLQFQVMTLQGLRIVSEKRSCFETMAVIQSFKDVQQAARSIREPPSQVVYGEAEEGDEEINTLRITNLSDPETVLSNEDLNMISVRQLSPHQRAEPRARFSLGHPVSYPGTLGPPEIETRKTRLCQCRTYQYRNSYQAPLWLQPILGSWRAEHSSAYKPAGSSFSNSCCDCFEGSSLKIEVYLPTWLDARGLLLKMAYSSSGLHLTLRPAKVIMDNYFLSWLIGGAGPQFVWMDDWIYFPEDHTQDGAGLMEVAIANNQLSVVKFVLNKWENLLQHRKLRREVGFYVYTLFQRTRLEEKDIEVLNQVLSFVEDAPAWGETTSVHEAARQGQGVKEALKKEPWALNKPDYMGDLPVHVASIRGNKEALEELIQANAGVDEGDDEGVTSLMFAVSKIHVDCVRLLLENGSSIERRDNSQETALHWAATSCDPEIVATLLAAGASPLARNILGESPLHMLGRDSTNHGKVEETLRLFLATGKINCEVLDGEGGTPLQRAIIESRQIALDCLVRAGASLQQLIANGKNLLHYAGQYSRLDILQYLLSFDPKIFLGINANQLDSWSWTPWDYFQNSLHPDSMFYRKEGAHQAYQRMFNQLLKTVHDTNIQNEKKILECAIGHIRHHRIDEAQFQLNLLIVQWSKWKENKMVGYYRGINQQIQAGFFDAVVTALKEDIEELNSRIGTSPWTTDCDLEWLISGSEDEGERIEEDDDADENEDTYETGESEDKVDDENARTA